MTHISYLIYYRYENISLFPKDINRLLGNRLPGEREVPSLIFFFAFQLEERIMAGLAAFFLLVNNSFSQWVTVKNSGS